MKETIKQLLKDISTKALTNIATKCILSYFEL